MSKRSKLKGLGFIAVSLSLVVGAIPAPVLAIADEKPSESFDVGVIKDTALDDARFDKEIPDTELEVEVKEFDSQPV